MKIRFLCTVGTSIILTPSVVQIVQENVQNSLAQNNLGWFNPGNTLGIFISYGAAAGMVSLVAKASKFKRFTVKGVLKAGGGATLIVAAYVGVRELISFYVGPELGLLSSVATAGILGFIALRKAFPEYPFDPHIAGQRLLASKEVKRKRGKLPPGHLPHGADWIEQRLEPEHILVMANIGGGKTLWLQICMAAIAERENELWWVFDPKPQFVPYLEALGREVIILNPLDRRRFTWDISADVDDEPTATNFSAALIKPEGEDDFWAMSARGILTSIFMFLINRGKPWDFRDVLNIVREPELVRQAVEEDVFNKIIAQGLTGVNERSGANDFLITLSQYMSRYKALAALMHSAKDGQRISLKGLIKSEQYGRIALVLGNDEDSRETIKLFNGLVFEMLVNYTLSLEDSRNRRIWALIDELASVADYVGRNLSRFQEKCRSKGGCAIVATQSYPALVAKLGPDYTDQIIELCKHKVIPGGVDGKTAEVLSDSYFGSIEVVNTQYGESKEYEGGSATPEEHDVKPTFSRTTRPLVRKEELYSSSMPKTGPKNGLTGFFFGSEGGPHFHTFSWQEVMDMRVEEAQVPAYERISMDDAGLKLTLWSDEELLEWGLTLEEEAEDDLAEDEPTLSRDSVLAKLDVTNGELKDICMRAELSEDKESFTREDLMNIFARVGADFLQIDLGDMSYD